MSPTPDIIIYRILPLKSPRPIFITEKRQEAEDFAKAMASKMDIELDAYEFYSKPRREIVHYSRPSLG